MNPTDLVQQSKNSVNTYTTQLPANNSEVFDQYYYNIGKVFRKFYPVRVLSSALNVFSKFLGQIDSFLTFPQADAAINDDKKVLSLITKSSEEIEKILEDALEALQKKVVNEKLSDKKISKIFKKIVSDKIEAVTKKIEAEIKKLDGKDDKAKELKDFLKATKDEVNHHIINSALLVNAAVLQNKIDHFSDKIEELEKEIKKFKKNGKKDQLDLALKIREAFHIVRDKAYASLSDIMHSNPDIFEIYSESSTTFPDGKTISQHTTLDKLPSSYEEGSEMAKKLMIKATESYILDSEMLNDRLKYIIKEIDDPEIRKLLMSETTNHKIEQLELSNVVLVATSESETNIPNATLATDGIEINKVEEYRIASNSTDR